MEVKLEIKAEQINEMLSQAVLDSVMEEHIKKMLVQAVENDRHWQYALEHAVQDTLGSVIAQEVEQHRDTIKEFVKVRLTDEFLEGMWEQVWSEMKRKAGRA